MNIGEYLRRPDKARTRCSGAVSKEQEDNKAGVPSRFCDKGLSWPLPSGDTEVELPSKVDENGTHPIEHNAEEHRLAPNATIMRSQGSVTHCEDEGDSDQHKDNAAKKRELYGELPMKEVIHRFFAGLRIAAHVAFFRKYSDLSDFSTIRQSEAALRVYDSYMRKKDVFNLRIGKKGVVVLTLTAPGMSTIPFHVQSVVMRVGAGKSYAMKFIQNNSADDQGQESTEIYAELSTEDPRLNVPSPLWGSVKEKYVTLNILIALSFALENEIECVRTFIKTIYLRMQRSTGIWTFLLDQYGRRNCINNSAGKTGIEQNHPSCKDQFTDSAKTTGLNQNDLYLTDHST